MSRYAIGDVQGCYEALCRLLDQIRFDPANDVLWFCGDLLNRGPDSLKVSRLVRSLKEQAIAVAGNHDLHFLAVALGAREQAKKDTFDELLRAYDLDEVVEWVRAMPLIHDGVVGQDQWLMVHAGLLPGWTLSQCRSVAEELRTLFRGPDLAAFLREMYSESPIRLDQAQTDFDRKRGLIDVLTRMRFCSADGALDLKHKGPATAPPRSMLPWYAHPHQRERSSKVVFGHWAYLGEAPLSPAVNRHGVYPLDTGCVYGGPLTALRLDDMQLFQSAGDTSRPGATTLKADTDRSWL